MLANINTVIFVFGLIWFILGIVAIVKQREISIHFAKCKIYKNTGKKVVNVKKGISLLGELIVEFELEDGTIMQEIEVMQ